MWEGETKRLGDDLRGCGGAEKLAASARRGTGSAAKLGGFFEGDLMLSISRADGLDFARIFAVFRVARLLRQE